MSFHTEASLLRAIASAPTLAEQGRLVEELQVLRAAQAHKVQADRDVEWADTVIRETLTPVATHVFHTAATDWMDEIAPAPAGDAHQEMMAEAAAWFRRTSAFVKSDDEEFAEQAMGMARRLAGKYGEDAAAAARSFLDYVAFLHSREAASGLDQIQQTTAPDGVTNKPTTLPQDVFDNFAEPVAPENQGVDEAQSSYNAETVNNMISGGPQGGGGIPSQHSTGNDYSHHYGPDAAAVKSASLEADDVAPFGSTSPALSYVASLDDFRSIFAAEAAATNDGDSDDDDSDDNCPNCGGPSIDGTTKGCPDCDARPSRNKTARRFEYVEGKWQRLAASGLDQIQQTTAPDGVTDKPTPIPGEVMFPLEGEFTEEPNTGAPGAPESPAQEHTTSTTAVVKEADMFGNSDAPHAVPGSEREGYNQETNASPKVAEVEEGEKDVPASISRDFSNDNTHDFTVKSSADYQKAFKFAQKWKQGDRLVSMGSAEFETGIFDGLTEDNREDFLAAHAAQSAKYPVLAQRLVTYASLAHHLAGTSSDLDTMAPSTYPDPSGNTPINGPGTKPPLAGGENPAAAGGPAPYNGVEPFGSSVVPGVDQKPNTPKPGQSPMERPPHQDTGHDPMSMSDQVVAFRKRVQAALLAENLNQSN